MLNRTVLTFLADNFRLNLGTRSTAANAVVFNGKPLRDRQALLGMPDHPMRVEIEMPEGKPLPSISRSPASPIARGVAVAEAPPAEPQVVDDGRGSRADRCRRSQPTAVRQDQASRQEAGVARSYRRPGTAWRLDSPTTERRPLAAPPSGLALG